MTCASILNEGLDIYRKFHITIDRQFIEASALFLVVIAIDDMAERCELGVAVKKIAEKAKK